MLRDDVKPLINKLIELYQKKLADFKVFYANEIKKKYLLQAGNFDTLMDLFAKDADFIADIDCLDYDITACYEKLAVIIGVPRQNVDFILKESYNNSQSKKQTEDTKSVSILFDTKKELHETLKLAYDERKKIIAGLKENADSLAVSIDELSNIQEFEFEDL